MSPATCARRHCTAVVRRRPRRNDCEKRLSIEADRVARDNQLLTEQGHSVVCVKHRKEICLLLRPPNINNVPSSPPSLAFSASSSSSHSASTAPPHHDPPSESPPSSASIEQLMAAAHLSVAQQSMATMAIPAIPLRSVSLPTLRHLPPPSPAAAPIHPAARHLGFTDLGHPVHPHSQVVHPHQQPRHSRLLTGEQYAERQQEREWRRQWSSKRVDRETISFQRAWKRMLERGSNLHCTWPLIGMQCLLEKTTCCSWDGEDDVRGGRLECQGYMQLVDMRRLTHDHIRAEARARDAEGK